MKKIIVVFTIFLLIFSIFISSANLMSASQFGDGLKGTGEGAGYDTESAAETQLDTVISLRVNAVISLLGVIFLILMIYGGFLWMTSRGNEQQVEKAKNLITSAIIGLVIVVSAYAISYFVISGLSPDEGGCEFGDSPYGGCMSEDGY